ncbi:MAG: M1 family aminopeptidase [Planctomycetota bacterium]
MKPCRTQLRPALSILLAAGIVPAQEQPNANQRYGDVVGQDARDYTISLRVDVAKKELVGIANYTFVAEQPLTSLRLDARRSDTWQVTFFDHAGKEMATEWAEEHVVLTLPKPAAAGDQLQFTAHLQGTPVDGFYFADNRYGEALAFTDHYSIRAHGWLPCEDNPADRAHFALRLEYPEGMEAVAYGAMKSEPGEHRDGFRALTATTDTEIPPYMFAIVVGPFARVHEDGDARLVDHLVYARDADKAAPLLTHHAQWLHKMEQTFGPYAFGKYTTVQCPTRWGGFEAPGNVQLAEGLFDNAAGGTGTLAHELVHMWFGDGVGYAEWREVWLAEGFASYFGPWLHADVGGPSLADSMRRMRTRWQQSFEGRTKTVRDDGFPHPDQALNSNTYPKGAWVLHMLRKELGDEKFFAAIKAYYTACRGRAVRTADFVDIVEHTAGTDLDWFFAQWLDRVGCPELKFTVGAEGVVVEQVQKGEPYTFWLTITAGHGEAQQRYPVRMTEARQVIAVDDVHQGFAVDPDVELLFRLAQ